MIQFNGVTLNPSLQWTDRFQFTGVAQAVNRTLGGKLVVFSSPLIAGRPITLVAEADTGWLTKAMVDAIVAAAATPGAQYTVSIHGEDFNVIFRHEDNPAIDFIPIQPKSNPLPGDWYTGTIKLLTV